MKFFSRKNKPIEAKDSKPIEVKSETSYFGGNTFDDESDKPKKTTSKKTEKQPSQPRINKPSKNRPNKSSKKTTKKTPQESEGQTSVKKIYISKELFRLILSVKIALSLNETESYSADSILKLLITGKYKSKITDENDLAIIKQYISKFQ